MFNPKVRETVNLAHDASEIRNYHYYRLMYSDEGNHIDFFIVIFQKEVTVCARVSQKFCNNWVDDSL